MNTLTPHITRYMRSRRALGTYGPKSDRVVTPRLRNLANHFGRRPLHHLTPKAVEKWMESISHMATNSRAAYLASVKQFTAWLHAEGLLAVDPCKQIAPLRRPRTVPRAQNQAAIAATIEACGTERDRAIVWLMVGCGLRRMEVSALRWDDYDERDQTIQVRGKGNKERILPVPAEVRDALEPLMRRSGGPIIEARYGGHLSAEAIGRIVSHAMRRAGVKRAPYDGVSGHALRHTAASDVLDGCGDLRVVQQMLGHEHLSTTSIYLRRVNARELRAAMEGRNYRAA